MKETLLDSRSVYRGKMIELKLETYQQDHTTKIAEIVRHPGAVVVAAVHSDHRILFVEQWRRPIQKRLLELPAGKIEPGEPPRETAHRELQEETGFAAKTLHALGGFYTSPGFCDEYLHFFIAQDLYASFLPKDEDEEIQIQMLSLEEALSQIDKGTIDDAKTIAGIFLYQKWSKRHA